MKNTAQHCISQVASTSLQIEHPFTFSKYLIASIDQQRIDLDLCILLLNQSFLSDLVPTIRTACRFGQHELRVIAATSRASISNRLLRYQVATTPARTARWSVDAVPTALSGVEKKSSN